MFGEDIGLVGIPFSRTPGYLYYVTVGKYTLPKCLSSPHLHRPFAVRVGRQNHPFNSTGAIILWRAPLESAKLLTERVSFAIFTVGHRF